MMAIPKSNRGTANRADCEDMHRGIDNYLHRLKALEDTDQGSRLREERTVIERRQTWLAIGLTAAVILTALICLKAVFL